MKEPYLEVTFRHGRPIAAYYYLPRGANQRSVRSRRVESGLVIDFGADGQAHRHRDHDAHQGLACGIERCA